MHVGKDWATIAALAPGLTKNQCHYRWHNSLDPSITLTAGRAGAWTEDEDIKLKAAVQTHGGKNWDAIAALVPGRTKYKCHQRWHNSLDPSIALTAGRKGGWTKDEDLKLKDGVHTHGGKNWDAIAALVSGRTKIQCYQRWQNGLNPSIDRAVRVGVRVNGQQMKTAS
jgi:myb proto-oncogene protein